MTFMVDPEVGRRGGGAARFGRTLAGSAAIIALSAVAIAQTANPTTNPPVDTSVPYGSPLGPSYGAAAAPPPPVTTAPVPVEIEQRLSDRDDVDASRSEGTTSSRQGNRRETAITAAQDVVQKPQVPGEFEQFVAERVGRTVPRFGADLIVPGSRDFAVPATATVPPSYLLNVGDEISIGLTGSVEGTLQATIDTDGRIFIPRVGPVRLIGVRYGDLRDTLRRAIGQQYRDFNVSVAIARLRGIRVYVTGFANNPGAYTVSSLSTMVNAALAAGGPSAGGSFRSIKLYRAGQLVSDFDLYALIRDGDKSKDAILQNQDVLYIPPVGEQIALTGSVNQEAIYEARPGETLGALVRYAGGLNPLADKSRVILYRVSNLDTVGGQQLTAAETETARAEGGDIVQVLSVGTLVRPLERQSVLVRIEGEVNRPGNYHVQPNASLAEAMALAGGTTSRAFVFGTRFERFSVRQQQRLSFEEAISQLEISLAAAPLTGDSSIPPATRASQLAAAQAVIARLRRTEPDGRMVLDLAPSATDLPGQLSLQNNDRIFIPAQPQTVGVFGAVYRPASFLIDGKAPQRVETYLRRAGGPLRVADRSEVFVVRANGAVLSKRNGALRAAIIPGDVIFVPVKTQTGVFWARVRDIASILLSFGITAAAVAAIDH